MKKTAKTEEPVKESKEQWEEDQMTRLTKKHENLKIIMLKVPKNDDYTEFAYAWLKYPDRADISIAMTMKDTDPLKGKEIIIRNSWLEGDQEILENTELFLSACTVLDEVIGVRQAILKKNWMNGR